MFQITVFVIIIIFCVGFIFLFPEFADQVPLEAFLADAFLIGQIIYLQVAFSEGIRQGIGRFFGSNYLPLTGLLLVALSLWVMMKGRKISDPSYLVFSIGLLAAFLVGSLAAFAVWSWSFGFFS